MAPIGWPLALRPPDGLTGSLPSFCGPAFLDGGRALPFGGQAHRLVLDQLGDGEAVVRLDEGEVVEGRRRPARAPAARPRAQPSNWMMSRFDIGRKSCAWAVARNATARRMRSAVSVSVSTSGRGAVRDERAVGALQRARRRRGSSRFPRGRTRSRDPCASAHRGCRRRSCGSSRRSWRARPTGRRGAGNSVPAILPNTPGEARPACRRPRAGRRP